MDDTAGSQPDRVTLSPRERRWALRTDLPCLVAILAIAAWVPAGRDLDPLLCLALVAGYSLSTHARIPLAPRDGYASASQLLFVPLLFLAPLNLVPALIFLGLLLGHVAAMVRGRWSPWRSLWALGDAWYSVFPVLVLTLGAPEFTWADAPLYAAALAAQVLGDVAVSTLRDVVASEDPARPRDVALAILRGPAVIDLVLSVPALLVVAESGRAPLAAGLAVVSLLVLANGLAFERRDRLDARHRALHDALTGLPNRVLFEELLTAAGARARRERAPGAVLLVDLDDFKAVNDELGHHAGDVVLREAARRFAAAVRESDTVARLGGDEFAVLLPDAQDPATVEAAAAKLRGALEAPIDLPGGPRSVGASVGCALLGPADPADEALARADAAMYADKAARHAGR